MLLAQPKSLTALAAAALREAILDGQLKPGERLLEVELSSRLSISRVPFREAVRELAAEGLVELRHHRGAHVASPTVEQLQHMILVRALVEGAAARLVTFRASERTFTRLATILDRLDVAIADSNDALVRSTHWEFHRTICEEARNPYLLQSWASISNLIRLYHSLTLDPLIVARNNRVFLATLRGGDPPLAEDLLRSQIIRMAYHNLGREIPAEMLGYSTHYIADHGSIAAYPVS